jgi:hypothetical protein
LFRTSKKNLPAGWEIATGQVSGSMFRKNRWYWTPRPFGPYLTRPFALLRSNYATTAGEGRREHGYCLGTRRGTHFANDFMGFGMRLEGDVEARFHHVNFVPLQCH